MILCQCSGVTDTTIQKLISEGAATVKAIAMGCGAGKKCKPCASEIARCSAAPTATRAKPPVAPSTVPKERFRFLE